MVYSCWACIILRWELLIFFSLVLIILTGDIGKLVQCIIIWMHIFYVIVTQIDRCYCNYNHLSMVYCRSNVVLSVQDLIRTRINERLFLQNSLTQPPPDQVVCLALVTLVIITLKEKAFHVAEIPTCFVNPLISFCCPALKCFCEKWQ